MGAKSTRRTILVGAIHPPASQSIGQIFRGLCMKVDEQSEQDKRTRARTGLLKPTNSCPRVLAQHLTLAVWVGDSESECPSSSPIWPSRTQLHPMKRFVWAARACLSEIETSYCIDMPQLEAISCSFAAPPRCCVLVFTN